MLRLLLVALFALFHIQVAAAESVTPPCITPTSLRNVVSAQLPQAEIAALAGVEAAMFLAGFNALPPQSHILADALLLIRLNSGANVALGFFKNGCLVSRGVLPRAQAEQLLLQLERSGA